MERNIDKIDDIQGAKNTKQLLLLEFLIYTNDKIILICWNIKQIVKTKTILLKHRRHNRH